MNHALEHYRRGTPVLRGTMELATDGFVVVHRLRHFRGLLRTLRRINPTSLSPWGWA